MKRFWRKLGSMNVNPTSYCRGHPVTGDRSYKRLVCYLPDWNYGNREPVHEAGLIKFMSNYGYEYCGYYMIWNKYKNYMFAKKVQDEDIINYGS
jgi:hypothetical protein